LLTARGVGGARAQTLAQRLQRKDGKVLSVKLHAWMSDAATDGCERSAPVLHCRLEVCRELTQRRSTTAMVAHICSLVEPVEEA
jgi:hypothetical protein